MTRPNRLDVAANSLIRYFERRAQRGRPEARRDWLYGPAHVPGGAWNMDELLDQVIRRAKDIGALMVPPFELVYVYDRPPCWTCRASAYVRDVNQAAELLREITAERRLERSAPAGSYNKQLAQGCVASLSATRTMLMVQINATDPTQDSVLRRIDATPNMAN